MKTAGGVTYVYDGDGRCAAKVGTKLYWYGSAEKYFPRPTPAATRRTNTCFSQASGWRWFRPRAACCIMPRICWVARGSWCKQMGRSATTPTSRLLRRADVRFDLRAELQVRRQRARHGNAKRRLRGARVFLRFGRWLSSDWSALPVPVPYANLTNPQTLNLYAMVADDPESFAELDGHKPQAFVIYPLQMCPGGTGLTPCASVPQTDQPATPPLMAQNNQQQQSASQNNGGSIISVSATSAAPTMLLGGVLGEMVAPPGGGVVGALLGSTFGTGGNISYVPSTDSYYAGPTVTFSPVLFSGTGATGSDVLVPRGQNPNSIANGTSFSVTFQPTPLTGSTVTKSPGSGPAVGGFAVGTKLPVSFGASHNWDITPTVKYVTGVVNRALETVKSWF